VTKLTAVFSHKETTMKTRTLIALAVIAGFAATAQAGGDKTTGASDKPSSASASAGSSASGASGAEKMFQALDKNQDGFLSRDEVKGSPHDKDFTTLDKNRDGKLSREEHAAAPEHASDKAASGASTAPASGTAAPSSSQPKSKY
jgi:hypothetical protein